MTPRAASSSYHAKAEVKAEIQPHRVTDDLGWEPITGIAGASRCHHPTRLPTPVRSRKRAGGLVDGALRGTILRTSKQKAIGNAT